MSDFTGTQANINTTIRRNVGMDMGEKLRTMRNNRGYSIEKLAELSGVSANAISLIERGVSEKIFNTTIESLAKVLRVSPLYFFKDSARTFFDVKEINESLTEELRKMLLDKESLPWMLLAKRAYEEKIPPEVVEELLNVITKVRNL